MCQAFLQAVLTDQAILHERSQWGTRSFMVTDQVPLRKEPLLSHRLRERAQAVGSWLCVGLDPDLNRLPSGCAPTTDGVVRFCREIIDATADLVACFKINFAFFEALGPEGWRALSIVRRSVPNGIPVIADAKRGDIGSTSAAYASAVFDQLDFDAVTVSPYLGWDAIAPFGNYAGRGILVLCRTSNPGGRDFQHLVVDGEPLYMHVARQTLAQSMAAELGLVVGAGNLDALRQVRALSSKVLVLAPGAGTQGADAREAVLAGANSDGENILVPVSRAIIYASGSSDFASAARSAAQRFALELRDA